MRWELDIGMLRKSFDCHQMTCKMYDCMSSVLNLWEIPMWKKPAEDKLLN